MRSLPAVSATQHCNLSVELSSTLTAAVCKRKLAKEGRVLLPCGLPGHLTLAKFTWSRCAPSQRTGAEERTMSLRLAATIIIVICVLFPSAAEAACPSIVPDCGRCRAPVCFFDGDGSYWICEADSTQDGLSCTDNNACTTGDHCSAGACVGTLITCTALDACHDAGTCNTSTGVCSNPLKANGTACNDGNACTSGETCQNGACGSPTSTVTCAALDQCHVAGVCDPATGGCSNPNAPNSTSCNDSNACTSGETCQNGVCGSPTSTVTCTPPDQCHVGTCSPSTGTCSYTAQADGTPCGAAGATGFTCQAGTCTCGVGHVVCSGNCLTGNCCFNSDCALPDGSGEQTCASNSCSAPLICSAGYSACGTKCIVSGACCSDADCPTGLTCANNSCSRNCPAGYQTCGNSCILPSAQVCCPQDT